MAKKNPKPTIAELEQAVEEGKQVQIEPSGDTDIAESVTSTTGETGDAYPTAETGDAAAPATSLPEVASPAIAPSQVRTLNVHGHCGNCGNPNIAKYGEGKWKCVCGAGNL